MHPLVVFISTLWNLIEFWLHSTVISCWICALTKDMTTSNAYFSIICHKRNDVRNKIMISIVISLLDLKTNVFKCIIPFDLVWPSREHRIVNESSHKYAFCETLEVLSRETHISYHKCQRCKHEDIIHHCCHGGTDDQMRIFKEAFGRWGTLKNAYIARLLLIVR